MSVYPVVSCLDSRQVCPKIFPAGFIQAHRMPFSHFSEPHKKPVGNASFPPTLLSCPFLRCPSFGFTIPSCEILLNHCTVEKITADHGLSTLCLTNYNSISAAAAPRLSSHVCRGLFATGLTITISMSESSESSMMTRAARFVEDRGVLPSGVRSLTSSASVLTSRCRWS